MKLKLTVLIALVLLVVVPFGASQLQQTSVKPARLEPVQNMGVLRDESGRPVYLPKEWGRLVSVERVSSDKHVMFLENDAGEIYLVQLLQKGAYLYLDTYDQGGVTLVIRRQ